MKILALSVLALTAPASAQVIFQPVRYQYGAYNEVFYGGRNPVFTSNAYVYLPPALEAAYNIQRLSAPSGENPYLPYGTQGPFVSPFVPDSTMSNPVYTPYVYSDYMPYQEVGQFGYTIDDARNEAYANISRIQTGYRPPTAAPAATVVGQTAPLETVVPPIADQREKAIPLLNWAKAERTRNPELYKALLAEAKKYDPAATDALERNVASDR